MHHPPVPHRQAVSSTVTEHTHTHTDTSSVQLLDVCGCNQLVVCTVFLQLLEQTEEKRRRKTIEKKSINLFYRSSLLCFYLANFFCKIDLGLDTISFLERLWKVCDSQNSQFFDPSSTVLYIRYNCE